MNKAYRWEMPTQANLMRAADITRLAGGEHLLHHGREFGCATMRQIAMYVICRELGFSTTVIGIMFRRDHSTVVHALQKVDFTPDLHKRAIVIQQQYEALYGRP